jgi:hypothetical protein
MVEFSGKILATVASGMQRLCFYLSEYKGLAKIATGDNDVRNVNVVRIVAGDAFG